jgi:hypothetical protein
MISPADADERGDASEPSVGGSRIVYQFFCNFAVTRDRELLAADFTEIRIHYPRGQDKLAQLDLVDAEAHNAWLEFAEQLHDNPLLDEVDAAVTDYRRDLDASDDAAA